MKNAPCPYCQFEVPHDWATCPHCARPSRFPNVLWAEEPEERQALDRRYQQARQEAIKLASRLRADTSATQFPGLLLKSATPETDDFVEVHVFGSLTVRAVACVIVRPKRRQPSKSQRQALEIELAKVNVPLEVRT